MTILQQSFDRVFAILSEPSFDELIEQQAERVAADFIIGHDAMTIGSPMVEIAKTAIRPMVTRRYVRVCFK